MANGWIFGEIYSDSSKVQPLMKPYKLLSEKVTPGQKSFKETLTLYIILY